MLHVDLGPSMDSIFPVPSLQVIPGRSHSRGFGSVLAGGKDLDNNGYPGE